MQIDFQSYSVREIGKLIRGSKVLHEWSFSICGEAQSASLTESRSSGKLRIFLDEKKILDSAPSKFEKHFGLNFLVRNPEIRVSFRKTGENRFDFILNSETFQPGTSRNLLAEFDNLPLKLSELDLANNLLVLKNSSSSASSSGDEGEDFREGFTSSFKEKKAKIA